MKTKNVSPWIMWFVGFASGYLRDDIVDSAGWPVWLLATFASYFVFYIAWKVFYFGKEK